MLSFRRPLPSQQNNVKNPTQRPQTVSMDRNRREQILQSDLATAGLFLRALTLA